MNVCKYAASVGIVDESSSYSCSALPSRCSAIAPMRFVNDFAEIIAGRFIFDSIRIGAVAACLTNDLSTTLDADRTDRRGLLNNFLGLSFIIIILLLFLSEITFGHATKIQSTMKENVVYKKKKCIYVRCRCFKICMTHDVFRLYYDTLAIGK